MVEVARKNVYGQGDLHSITVDLDKGERLQDMIDYIVLWPKNKFGEMVWQDHVEGGKVPILSLTPISPGFRPISYFTEVKGYVYVAYKNKKGNWVQKEGCPQEIFDFLTKKIGHKEINEYYLRTTENTTGHSAAESGSGADGFEGSATVAEGQSKRNEKTPDSPILPDMPRHNTRDGQGDGLPPRVRGTGKVLPQERNSRPNKRYKGFKVNKTARITNSNSGQTKQGSGR